MFSEQSSEELVSVLTLFGVPATCRAVSGCRYQCRALADVALDLWNDVSRVVSAARMEILPRRCLSLVALVATDVLSCRCATTV